MHRTLISILAAAAVALAGCSSGNNLQDPAVYSQRGMEISRIAAGVTDTLYSTMYENLVWQKVAEGETASRDRVKNVTMPRVAVTSFVDTDTYEQAGHLGRVLSQENKVLSSRDAQAINELSQKKSKLKHTLQQNGQKIKLHPDAARLKIDFAKHVQVLKLKLAKCKRRNEVNGRLIRLCQSSCRRLSAVLMGVRDTMTRQ